MIMNRCLIAVALLAVFTGGSAYANTYYVSSSSGNDANAGTSASAPWRTLAKVNTSTFLTPGDEILLKRGDIWRETLFMPASGNATSFIHVGAYGEGEAKPVISGAEVVAASSWQYQGGGIYAAPLPTRCWIVTVDDEFAPEGVSSTDLQAGEWKWSNGYLYYCGDPSGKIIEAAQRDHAFVGTNDSNGNQVFDEIDEATYKQHNNVAEVPPDFYTWDMRCYTVDGLLLEKTNSSAFIVKRTAGNPIRVTNNWIRFCNSSHNDASAAAGIQLWGVKSVEGQDPLIQGNSLEFLLGEGIRATKCAGIQIVGNTIRNIKRGHNPYGDAIQITAGYFTGEGANFKVVDNDIDVSGSATGKGAIQVEGIEGGLIAGNTIRYGRFGIGITARDVMIKNNTLMHTGTEPHDGVHEGWPAAIRIGGSLTYSEQALWNNTIRHNLIYGARNHAIQIVNGLQRQNFLIVHNTVHMSGDGFTVEDNSTISGLMANNLFWTSSNPDESNSYMFEVAETSQGAFHADYNLYGNAAMAAGGRFISWNSATFSSFADYQNASSIQHDTHSFFADPLFLDPAANDFSLGTGSPAQDAGMAALATALNSGSSATNLNVDRPWLFDDGRSVTTGDEILIGSGEPVLVTDVDYAGGYLTLESPRSWTTGDPVSFRFHDAAPDLGAIEQIGDGGEPAQGDDPVTLILDNDSSAVTLTSNWFNYQRVDQYGADYLSDDGFFKGGKFVTYTPNVPVNNAYSVYMWWPADASHASNVPVDIQHETGTERILVDQQQNGGMWNYLGTFSFAAGTTGKVIIGTANTHGSIVVADAVMLVSESASLPFLLFEAEQYDNDTSTFVPFAVFSDSNASNTEYIEVPNGTGNLSNPNDPLYTDYAEAHYAFFADSVMDLTFWARVDFPNGYDNSFHYQLDESGWVVYNSGGTTPDWEWRQIATFSALSAGTHTLQIKQREDGAKLDCFYLTADGVAPEYLLDNADTSGVSFTSNWDIISLSGQYGNTVADDKGFNKGGKTATFSFDLPEAVRMELQMRWPAHPDHATAVPVNIQHANGSTTVYVNQQLNGGEWMSLGTYDFDPASCAVVIVNDTPQGTHVVADAVRLLRSEN